MLDVHQWDRTVIIIYYVMFEKSTVKKIKKIVGIIMFAQICDNEAYTEEAYNEKGFLKYSNDAKMIKENCSIDCIVYQ